MLKQPYQTGVSGRYANIGRGMLPWVVLAAGNGLNPRLHIS
jgi:hypothetical protein